MGRLEGKVALVTGARRGIGSGIALCFAEEGADVLIGDLVCDNEAAQLVDTIRKLGRRACTQEVDVSDRDQVQAWIREGVQRFGRLDIAVANAAYSVRENVVDASWANVERIIAVSQLGVFHTCQLAARQMIKQGGGGKIIVIGSIHSELSFPTSGAYSMAKAAVNQLAATLANELAIHNINVNIINPGWIDTPGERSFASEDDLRRGANRIPRGRLGTPRDIGRCAVFLASEDADYITGTSLRVDGGYMVGLVLQDVRPGQVK
jgi:glucose 1-dehydrogenase